MVNSTNSHPDTYHGGKDERNHGYDTSMLRYEDPALLNPDELATFPKQVNLHAHHHEQGPLHHGKRTPVRDGRNITRTDNHPDKNGFM